MITNDLRPAVTGGVYKGDWGVTDDCERFLLT